MTVCSTYGRATIAFGFLESAALHAEIIAAPAPRVSTPSSSARVAAPLAVVAAPTSYADIASLDYYKSEGFAEIEGILQHYDLPDVAAAVVSLPVLLPCSCASCVLC